MIMYLFGNRKYVWSVLATLVAFLGITGVAFSVDFTKFAPGDTITIGDFLYNDDFTASTDDCSVTIYTPGGSVDVNNVTMTANANGWHYYEYTAPVTEGTYPAHMTCGTALAGDLVKADKTFIVEAPDVTNDSIATSVWSSGTRTLTAFGSLAADVWNDTYASVRRLTDKTLTGGGSLATETALSATESAIVSEVQTTQGLINALNNISAADVWSYGTRSTNSGTVTLASGSLSDIWDKASSGLSTAGSIGKLIVDNLDTQVSSRGTSTLTAADVWNSATRTLSDYSTSSIATAVWGNAARTLTNYGNDITAADVWNVLSSSLTTVDSIGEQLKTNNDVKASDILAQTQTNESLISALTTISASDVWNYSGRDLDGPVDISTTSQQAIWDVASVNLSTAGSIGKRLADNIDAQVSSRGVSNLTAADVWSAATRTLTDNASSALAAAVWANGTRTLTSYGNDITAADVWNVLSSTLTTVGTIGEQLGSNIDGQISMVGGTTNWNVRMSNVERVQTGHTYRTKVFVLNASAEPTTPFATPTVTVYDADRNAVASNIAMTALSTGVYEYTYNVSASASQGLWEVVASTEVESGKVIQTNDYWEVAGSPAQVIINSVDGSDKSNISANITITNEGLSGYEYQYEWCIVDSINNDCGGGDDNFYSLAAKFINPGDSWNTALTGNVGTEGTYYFKLVVHFGTDSSTASRVFTAATSNSGGGGGGGGGGGSSGTDTNIAGNNGCGLSSDFSNDCSVGSVDFSIMLSFWKTKPPFKNPKVDINKDGKVDSIDFSILLYQWTKKKL